MSVKLKAPLILASASVRRKKLLREAGYKFKVIPSAVNEPAVTLKHISPAEFAIRLAFAKTMDVAKKYPRAIVIGADTVVDYNGRTVGKASNPAHAERILRALFSKPHKVITAVAIISQSLGVHRVETDTTTVYPKKLTARQIKDYIATGHWRGKAGAYGIQEKGDEFVERIDGSLTNVMGFPMELVTHLLKKFVR